MYANSFATPYVMDPLLDTMSLREHLWDIFSCSWSHLFHQIALCPLMFVLVFLCLAGILV